MCLTLAVKETICKLNAKGALRFCQFRRKMAECSNSSTFHFIIRRYLEGGRKPREDLRTERVNFETVGAKVYQLIKSQPEIGIQRSGAVQNLILLGVELNKS